MKLSEVLIKPILTEKANSQQDKLRRYAFKVAKKANKLEIKKAVESFYGVTVTNVNTSVVPGKNKSRFTKSGVISGRKPSYKKAFVTVRHGRDDGGDRVRVVEHGPILSWADVCATWFARGSARAQRSGLIAFGPRGPRHWTLIKNASGAYLLSASSY